MLSPCPSLVIPATARSAAVRPPSPHNPEPIPPPSPVMLDPCRVLEWAFGPQFQETGRNTLGHRIVNTEDRERAGEQHANLLYGEVLPAGVTTLLDPQHLNAGRASKLVDIGSGCGKLAVQAFIEFPNLESVIGVEICHSRAQVGINALRGLCKKHPQLFQLEDQDKVSCCITIDDVVASGGMIGEEFKNGGHPRGQLSNAPDPRDRQVLAPPDRPQGLLPVLEKPKPQPPSQQVNQQTSLAPQAVQDDNSSSSPADRPGLQPLPREFAPMVCHHMQKPPPAPKHSARLAGKLAGFAGPGEPKKRTLELREGNMFLSKDIFDADVVICETKVPQAMMSKLHELICSFKKGARILTYDDLSLEFETLGLSLPVRRIGNRDRVLTSWAVSFGHLFHLWERV